ncbi:MAG: uroporphyrinogen decarboxylase family protein [Planctomycetota bacterium]|nr:uroporphyrinogen decarboxylase family protein [Planctomycetota bacterium]
MTDTHTGQPYGFSFSDSLLAEVGNVLQSALHHDADAICRAYEAVVPVAERLGVDPPQPRLAGFAYNHASTLGAKITFKPDSPEPGISPCIDILEDIDRLTEPADYLAAGIVPQRLEALRQLKARRPDAGNHIGHDYEGPITTAVLLMGQKFLMLPYDDPVRAHRLLEFCVRSALNYTRILKEHQNRPTGPQPVGMCDDFGGMFPPEKFGEFVAPYWEEMYAGQQATDRFLHSELLRREHLPFLTGLKINTFDPSVDEHITPEILREDCKVPYMLRIWPAWMQQQSTGELVRLYRRLAGFAPTHISFSLDRLEDEQKVAAVLEAAREMA